ncbi:MAG: hypothetical protein IJ783_04100 [Kiritimatiellae bacterium]|nr:hypothetical protein [Kiritimatiellia bacterium]
MDPTVPATFAADEPDEDGDGIPDIWENDFIPVFFGVDPDGFPWGVDVPEATENNYDVTLTVTSSRHASLSWGAGQGESLLLPPCTNLAIRLRLSADAAKTVALSPSPDSATPPVGTWMASLSADWDWRRGLENENDRVALQDGTMVDRSGRESVATAAWLPLAGIRAGAPARGGRAQRNPSISFTPRKVELELENSFCPVHGPAPAVRVRGEGTSPPYIWIEHGEGIETQSDRYVPTRPHPDGRFVVTVRWSDGHEGLFVEDKAIVAPTPCRPGRTNFVGAAWSSTHDPADPSDHAPGVEEVETHFGPLCPVARDTNVRAGWTHDTGKLWIRNLVRILTGDPQDDETDHCIGLPYDSSEVIDLWSFLSDVCTPYRDRFVFKVNGFPIQGHIVKMSDFATSDDLKPRVLHISFSLDDSREMDRMWVVLYSTNLASSYNAWKNRFTNTAWTTKLPAVPSSIGLVSNDSGSVFVDSSRTYPGWRSPTRISSLLHHDAIYEMRSEPVGQHGHQATYRKDGTLISTTISAGTADYFHPLSFRFSWSNFVVERHYVDDVIPFLRAVSLDGNPGAYNSRYVPTDLSHPCLYQGQNLDDYISRRPTLPTGTRQ